MRSLAFSILALILCLAVPTQAETDSADPLIDGWTQLFVRNYPQAEDLFERVLEDAASGSDRALRARFGLAMVERHDSGRFDRDRTVATLEEILAQIPRAQREFRALILFQMALAYQPGVLDTTEQANELREKSLPIYERIIDEMPGTDEAVLALIDASQLRMKIDPEANTRPIIERYTQTLERDDLTPVGRRLLLQGLANQYRVLEDWENTDSYLTLWVDAGIETEWLRAQTLFSIGEINQRFLDNHEKAIEYYERVANDYPFFNYASECGRRAAVLRREHGIQED